jgi:hypothetical protein
MINIDRRNSDPPSKPLERFGRRQNGSHQVAIGNTIVRHTKLLT